MKEIVWVFGNSAAGKETFVKYMANKPDSEILKELGWTNKEITACKESIEFVGKFDNDPIVEKRSQILSCVNQHVVTADVVLIKWQYTDSVANLPLKLMKTMPQFRHRIICLQTSDKEFSLRLPRKSAWKTTMDPVELARRERIMVADEIAKLSHKYEVKLVDSSKLNDYKIINNQD